MLAQISIACNRWFKIYSRQKTQRPSTFEPFMWLHFWNTEKYCPFDLFSKFEQCVWWVYSFINVNMHSLCLHVLYVTWICQCAVTCFDDLACTCVLSAQACEHGCVFRLGVGGATDISYSDLWVWHWCYLDSIYPAEQCNWVSQRNESIPHR